jgi:fructose/tagatose bisphosphate aldolase
MHAVAVHQGRNFGGERLRKSFDRFNISTDLNMPFTEAVAQALDAPQPPADPRRRYISAGREAVAAEVERLLQLLANA